MAEAGLTVYLQGGGEVQIDSTYKNMEFISKYIIGTTNVNGLYVGSLSVYGVTPIVAFNSGTYAGVRAISVSGSTFTFEFISMQPGNITVYLYDTPRTVGNYGLQVFDGSGNLTFDSSRRYMKIVSDVTITNYNNNLGVPIVLPSGKTYAILQSQFLGYHQGNFFLPGEGGPTFFQTEINSILYTISGNVAYLNIFITFSNTASAGLQQPYYVDRQSGQLQFIDVTGL